MTDQLALALTAKQRAIREVTAKHAAELERHAPLFRELLRAKGEFGVTVGEWRHEAIKRGLLPLHSEGRELSWTTGLPKHAGGRPTDRRRLSPLPKSRNSHVVWVLAA